ncbi:MAG: hypothetical protein ACM3JC_12410 [Rudaea sp.]
MERIEQRRGRPTDVDEAASRTRDATPGVRPPWRPKALPLVLAAIVGFGSAALLATRDVARAQAPAARGAAARDAGPRPDLSGARFEAEVAKNTRKLLQDGRDAFRFDTFGDEDFWGGTLQLHQAIEGSALGGVGPGITPRTAMSLGLKVDADAFLEAQRVPKSPPLDLDSPAGTLALLKANAVVGLTGFFNADGSLESVGIQCALCHSTVDNSVAFGIGRRLDGWANHDLDVGKIIASAPNLTPFATLLGVDVATVKAVLESWGPGKFDAALALDGKAFNPQQVTHGVVTGTNVSAATLIPNAFGLAGYNQHTWTGAWGSVPYWNAFVAALEMHGKGRFFDPRLDNAAQFPIAAANGFGDLPHINPDDDRITPKLAALQFYQLSLPAPAPRAGVDFDAQAAKRGDELFSGKAGCNNCHVEPLWTEPGWNLHKPSDIGIDSFEADRAPDHAYKTANLAGLFVRENGIFMNPANKGRYFHDGRFATLADVVDHYDTFFKLALTAQEKHDLVEYLKSLPEKG